MAVIEADLEPSADQPPPADPPMTLIGYGGERPECPLCKKPNELGWHEKRGDYHPCCWFTIDSNPEATRCRAGC